jgi:DNA-binding response OmpR family regulator
MTKVLVIEDDVQIRKTLTDLLELEGFKAIAAENGVAGVLMAQTEQPDLIMCDVVMPELDGYGVLKQLRQNDVTAIIPFIFLTAKSEHVDVRQGMELGADDYLTKPFTSAELRRAIATRLEKHTAMMRQYHQECDRTKEYQKRVQENQLVIETQEELLKKLMADIRDPLSNINMAIRMLEQADSDIERDRYLSILKEECAREITLLNQMSQLQELMTQKNIKLLRQFQILKS